jgi:hypothetical protein
LAVAAAAGVTGVSAGCSLFVSLDRLAAGGCKAACEGASAAPTDDARVNDTSEGWQLDTDDADPVNDATNVTTDDASGLDSAGEDVHTSAPVDASQMADADLCTPASSPGLDGCGGAPPLAEMFRNTDEIGAWKGNFAAIETSDGSALEAFTVASDANAAHVHPSGLRPGRGHVWGGVRRRRLLQSGPPVRHRLPHGGSPLDQTRKRTRMTESVRIEKAPAQRSRRGS